MYICPRLQRAATQAGRSTTPAFLGLNTVHERQTSNFQTSNRDARVAVTVDAALFTNLLPRPTMKSRRLLYLTFASISLVVGWSFFVLRPLVPISELTLDVLSSVIDVLRPLGNFSGDAFRFKSVPHPYILEDVIPEQRLPWKPYMNESLDLFRHTYVISLPYRMDRRVDMEKIREVLSVNWTYVDAIDAKDASVTQVVHCVRERALNSSGANAFNWPTSFDDQIVNAEDSGLWCAPLQIADSAQSTVPELPPLTCARRNFTRGPPYDPSLPSYMLLTPPKVACWSSHLRVLERFVFSPRSSLQDRIPAIGLILEDDVNIERDIQDRLEVLMEALPSDWDMVFLG